MRRMVLAISLSTLLLSACTTTLETSRTTSIRDSVITFQPPVIHDTVWVEGETPSGVYNAGCDTLMILAKYGSFTVSNQDSTGRYWKGRFNAKTREFDLLVKQPKVEKIVPIFYSYAETKIQKQSLAERLGQYVIGGSLALGLCLIVGVILKVKAII